MVDNQQLSLNFEFSNGNFFCKACLEDKPKTEASPDERYCQFCFAFLLEEAKRLPANKRPRWVPKSHPRASG